MTEAILLFLGLGTVVGVAAGLFGIGGGLLVVPVLSQWFSLQMPTAGYATHLAVGTSLATIIPTAASAVYAHHRRQAVHWDALKGLAPGIVLGSLTGALLAARLPGHGLATLFGAFELLVAARLALAWRPTAGRQLPRPLALRGAGGLIGTLSAMLGIGGGTLTVPYLSWAGLAMPRAVATASACGLPIAVVGAAGFLITGWEATRTLDWASGYIYWPAFAGVVAASTAAAPLGARLAHRLPVAVLRRAFAVLLALLGVKMILG